MPSGLLVDMAPRGTTLKKKIKQGQTMQYNIILVIGDEEVNLGHLMHFDPSWSLRVVSLSVRFFVSLILFLYVHFLTLFPFFGFGFFDTDRFI